MTITFVHPSTFEVLLEQQKFEFVSAVTDHSGEERHARLDARGRILTTSLTTDQVADQNADHATHPVSDAVPNDAEIRVLGTA